MVTHLMGLGMAALVLQQPLVQFEVGIRLGRNRMTAVRIEGQAGLSPKRPDNPHHTRGEVRSYHLVALVMKSSRVIGRQEVVETNTGCHSLLK